MSDLVPISTKVKPGVREDLEEIARRRRKATGEEVRLSGLIREALEKFISTELPDRQR